MCERGLKAVSFREEQERFNLWVSLINLEHKYGSRASLKAASERACRNSNPKKVYLHMAEVSSSGGLIDSVKYERVEYRRRKKSWQPTGRRQSTAKERRFFFRVGKVNL